MMLTIVVLLLNIPAIPQSSNSAVLTDAAEVAHAAPPNASAKPDTSVKSDGRATAIPSDRIEIGVKASPPPPASESQTSEGFSRASDVSSEDASAAPCSLAKS